MIRRDKKTKNKKDFDATALDFVDPVPQDCRVPRKLGVHTPRTPAKETELASHPSLQPLSTQDRCGKPSGRLQWNP